VIRLHAAIGGCRLSTAFAEQLFKVCNIEQLLGWGWDLR
jgi:hypothetical protein